MEKRTKEMIQHGSAVGMLLLGSGLAIAGFIQSSQGQIHDSVLWLFAQCLLYAGSIFGVLVYISDRFSRIENKIHKKLNKEEDENEADK